MKIIMRKKDNAVEETGADILNVQYLGNVVADSGLCGWWFYPGCVQPLY